MVAVEFHVIALGREAESSWLPTAVYFDLIWEIMMAVMMSATICTTMVASVNEHRVMAENVEQKKSLPG